MNLVNFHAVEPEAADQETRSITLRKPRPGLPAGDYAFLEWYCPDPDCDCRRVMLNVIGREFPHGFLASISYGFDRDLPDAGPYLDPLNPQSKYAPALLQLVIDSLLTDPAYRARLERHYAMVKRAAADPQHPAYTMLQARIAESRDAVTALIKTAETVDVKRNDPCPCGSGKKYKYCCGRRK